MESADDGLFITLLCLFSPSHSSRGLSLCLSLFVYLGGGWCFVKPCL